MPAFEYKALDRQGKERKGVIEGDTPRQARGQLRDQGLTPLELAELKEKQGAQTVARWWNFSRGLNPSDLALITRQMATLIRSALPVEEVLRAVSQQTEKPRVRNLLMSIRGKVLEGYSFAKALEDFPNAFPRYYQATVTAGEQSGHLEVVLERLADYAESRQRLRQRLILALIYPALVSTVAILMVVGLLTYVVPQVTQVFLGVGQELPKLTQGLISVSHFLQDWGIWLLVTMGFMLWSGWQLLKREPIRYWVHRQLLRLPLASRLIKGLNAERFARTFSILMASGVPVLEGLRISAEVMNNLPMQRAVLEALGRVREGSSIYHALEHSRLFPPIMLHIIASGESSGRLDVMLERAADNQEREVETLVSTLLGIFEPLMILLMGGIVLVIVLAILLPIFELNQLVK